MSTQSIEEIVRRMVRKHFETEQGIERVAWFKNGGTEEIRVILVNRNTFPEGRILPFYQRPTREIPLPVQIGDITPEEWEKARSGRIPLPDGWYWRDVEILEREESTDAIGAAQENSTCSTPSIEEIVLRLARKHFEIEPGIERIIWFKDGLQEEVRLLEVNRDTFSVGQIMTFYQRPTLEFPLSLHLADATPAEWEKVKGGEILLPVGWSLHDAQIIERAKASAAPAFVPLPKPAVKKEKIDMSTKKIEEMVWRLAREHFEVEEDIERIIWFKDGERKKIRLLEVNRNSIPENLILTVYLKPTPERPLPALMGDITPEEWGKVKMGVIPLPEGWSLDNAEVLEREEVLQSTDYSNLQLETR